MNNYKFGKGSKSKLYGDDDHVPVASITAELCELALVYSTVDFSITDGHRTSAQQRVMYDNNRSSLDGTRLISDHQYGLAIDVYPCVRKNGKRVNMYKVDKSLVRNAWLEVYRAFMRASMKLDLVIEFGLGYNISGGRDYPHITILGYTPKDSSGLRLPLE